MKGEAVIFILLLNRLGAALIKIEIAASCMNKSVMYKKNFDFRLGGYKSEKTTNCCKDWEQFFGG